MKQHFTSNPPQQLRSDAPSAPATHSEPDASSSDNNPEQGQPVMDQSDLGIKQAAQLGKHLYDQLQKQMSGKPPSDVFKQSRTDMSTEAHSQQTNGAASQAATSAPAQDISIEGADMCTNDQGTLLTPKAQSSSAVRESSAAATLRRPDALTYRVCPAYGHSSVTVLSLCHLVDTHADHSCQDQRDCGVDSSSCTPRVCSLHGFCQAG